MANGQQKAKENVIAFRNWVATMTDDDYRQLVFRGLLNRTEVAKAIGCAKSALRQNPALKRELEKLENSLRPPLSDVLPPLTEEAESNKDTVKQYDTSKSKSMRESKRLSELEVENNQLKAENDALRSALKRHELMAEVASTLVKFGLVKKDV